MKRKILLIILSLMYFADINAQTISGKITDNNTKEGLIGVNIILENGSGTSSDVFGDYNIIVNPGINKITFKYIGYKEITKEISVTANENKKLNIVLSPASEELSTVVVSAGRFEQKIEEITVSMEVIKPTLIENKNTTRIETAMEQIPGVNITDGQANIRGGSGWSYGAGTRVSVLVDDMPLISGDAGQVQWKLIATENINQVEVIKGAASALYGSSALNGIINIRTAFPSQKQIDQNPSPGYTKINMHMGLIDKPERESLNWNGDLRRAFKGIEFLHSRKINNLDLSLGGNIFQDDGFRKGEVIDRKRFNLNSTYRSKKIKGLSYGLNGNFLFQSSGSAIIWHSYENAYIPLNDEITTTNGDTYNIDPFVTYISDNNKHSLKTRYLKVINDNSTKGQDAGQDNKSQIYYSDYQWQKNLRNLDLLITVGTTNEWVYASSDLFNGKNIRLNNSLYTQLDKKYGKLNLSIGGRYESFKLSSDRGYVLNGDSIKSFQAGRPVFRTGLNYQLAKGTFLRSSFGQGYRFPSMAELFISTEVSSGIYVYPNIELKPENGWSAEIGIKQALSFGEWIGFIDVAGFIMRYDDMMEFTFGKWGENEGIDNFFGLGFKSVNIGNTEISGVEISINGQGKINTNTTINLIGGYTYMNPISLSPDETYMTIEEPGVFLDGEYITDLTYNNTSSDPSILKYRYQHIAKLDAEIIHKRLSFGASIRYNDFMKNIDKIFADTTIFSALVPGINESREEAKNGDIIIDARIGFNLNKFTRLGFVVNNVLNKEYITRPAIMLSPRTFALQCNLKI